MERDGGVRPGGDGDGPRTLGAERNAAGQDLLAAIPVAMLAAATLVAYAAARVGGPSRNAFRIAGFGSAVVLFGYVLLARGSA